MRRLRSAVFCIALLACGAAQAGAGGTESPFSLGAGARELGMGTADLVYSAPAVAVFWNPAGLAFTERYSLEAFHSGLYDSDVGYQYFGFAAPTMDFGSFGVGVFRLGVDGIDKRDAGNLHLGWISDSRLGLYLGYGRTVSGYDLGAAVTVEQHSPDVYSATSSPGVTLAAGRRFGLDGARVPEIGAVLVARNVVRPGIKLDNESVTYPYSIEGGVSVELRPTGSPDHVVMLSARLTKVEDLDLRAAFGADYSLHRNLGLRAGVRDGEVSAGFGFFYKYVGFDYAMARRDLGTMHVFSLSARFGVPVGEKRRKREESREAEFNELLSRRFAESNRRMVDGLIEEGGRLSASGDLARAVLLYEKALFIAAGAGMDTVEISRRAAGARRRLEAEEREAAYARNMNDARERFDAGDFVGARYFANLALSIDPGSGEAASLLERADAAAAKRVSRGQEIDRGLMMADSLTSYGEIDEALLVTRSLLRIAPDDPRVRLALKKAEFAHWRDAAEGGFARGDYGAAKAALDSAAVRFPDHPWVKNLGARLAAEKKRLAEAPEPEPTAAPARALSPEMQREVAATYKRGQDLFEKGRLAEAVSEWERVEALAPGYMSVREYLVNAYKFLGVDLYTQSKLGEAVDVWKKAARLAPDSAEIANYIKRTEHEISKLEEISYGR